MRQFKFVSLAALLLVAAWFGMRPQVYAQTSVTELSDLAVELWPDYDRPAMLVLLTGTLPAGTSLPATVTVPLPADAELHAVAFFDETGVLKQLPPGDGYTVADGRLTLFSPGTRFRVEYYAPYTADGQERSYRFDWTSDLTVDRLSTVVQQPLAAATIDVSPAPDGAATERGDGLNYYTVPPRAVGPGEPYTVDVGYTAENPILSAPQQTLPGATVAAPVPTATAQSGPGAWWLAGIATLVVAGLAAGWYLGRRQSGSLSRTRKPRPARTGTSSAKPATGKTRYCHNCGQQAQPEDTYCRNCGTQLKSGDKSSTTNGS